MRLKSIIKSIWTVFFVLGDVEIVQRLSAADITVVDAIRGGKTDMESGILRGEIADVIF